MKTRRSTLRSVVVLMAVIGMMFAPMVSSVTAAGAYPNTAYFTGQGFIADGFGGYALDSELCGVANGAEVDGPYLLWVLTATKSDNADITGPWGTAEMTKFGGGTFKYVSDWYDPDTLPGSVTATFDGKTKNAQLVVSHGCRPFEEGAWCSPGFWKNAKPAAWALVGVSDQALFDETVYDYWYGAKLGTELVQGPTLRVVLDNANTYSGPPVAGTSGYQLNAFNGTGAYLTNLIPGYDFNWDVMMSGSDSACPIDHHGNFK
jgi:hypothetical protein